HRNELCVNVQTVFLLIFRAGFVGLVWGPITRFVWVRGPCLLQWDRPLAVVRVMGPGVMIVPETAQSAPRRNICATGIEDGTLRVASAMPLYESHYYCYCRSTLGTRCRLN
ncbi:unnamed protein product, partial [Ectocarpus sp. 13 AM-2016]